jgi:hypothetical protein
VIPVPENAVIDQNKMVKQVLRDQAIDQEQWDDGKRKHPRIENDPLPCFEIIDLTIKLKSFANAQLVERCIQSQDQAFLPYQQDNIQTLYVRQCYQDVFQLLLQRINLNQESFLISGTPGKSESHCLTAL